LVLEIFVVVDEENNIVERGYFQEQVRVLMQVAG